MSTDVARQFTVADFDGAPPARDDPASTVAGRLLSISFLLRALRRRWKVWATTAVVGMLIGAAFSTAVPPRPSAATTILLRHPRASDPARAMATDVTLIMTGSVARSAFARLGPGVPTRGLSYLASPLSDDLMQITAHAPSGRTAVRLADALAAAFFEFRRNQSEQQSDAVVRALQDRQRALNDELDAVTVRIKDLQPAGPPTSDVPTTGPLADAQARQAIITDELTQLRLAVGGSVIDTESVLAASSVIEPASQVTPSKKKALTSNLVAGLVAGIAGGAAWVVLWAVISDRVRRREDVMVALGAPVTMSTGPLARSVRAWGQRFRRHPAGPDGDLSRIVRRLGRLVGSDERSKRRLLVISVDSDGPAAAAVAYLAADLAGNGRRVLLADFSSGSALARLLKAPLATTSTVEISGVTSHLQVTCPPHQALAGTDGSSSDLTVLREESDVVLTVATLDPGLGAWHLSDWATSAVVIVTAGRSSEDVLRSAARMLRAAGCDLHSVILVGADGNDDTVGLLDGSRQTAVDAPLGSTR